MVTLYCPKCDEEFKSKINKELVDFSEKHRQKHTKVTVVKVPSK